MIQGNVVDLLLRSSGPVAAAVRRFMDADPNKTVTVDAGVHDSGPIPAALTGVEPAGTSSRARTIAAILSAGITRPTPPSYFRAVKFGTIDAAEIRAPSTMLMRVRNGADCSYQGA